MVFVIDEVGIGTKLLKNYAYSKKGERVVVRFLVFPIDFSSGSRSFWGRTSHARSASAGTVASRYNSLRSEVKPTKLTAVTLNIWWRQWRRSTPIQSWSFNTTTWYPTRTPGLCNWFRKTGSTWYIARAIRRSFLPWRTCLLTSKDRWAPTSSKTLGILLKRWPGSSLHTSLGRSKSFIRRSSTTYWTSGGRRTSGAWGTCVRDFVVFVVLECQRLERNAVGYGACRK